MLLLLIPAIPLMGALILYLTKTSGRKIGDSPAETTTKTRVPLIVSTAVLILSVVLLKDVLKGTTLIYEIPFSGPFRPSFRADPLSAIFVVLSAFLWFVVSIYSPEYMKHEGKNRVFQICTLIVLSAVLGVFLAGDLFTMLFFFELMTITSYFWVVHRWNREAIKAGYFYLFYSIIGGLFIALGIVMMDVATGGGLPTIGSGPVVPLNSKLFVFSITLFVAGFGIKAGMVPLHLWLPHAHSVAPTPGSALLSGLLIKVGAYGLIRTGEFVGWGISSGSEIPQLGTILTIIGTCTMLVGVTAALLQSDAKRLLAYHSVSQMGYIILGLGIGLYLGQDGGFGLLGSIYHIINHALFKATLFLGVGIIYIHTKETNLYNLGGLWRRFPVTAVLMFMAVLGITGTPGLNGYASKTLLHHAVSLAADIDKPWIILVEWVFLLVGVGTTASFSKLYYLMFLSKPTKITTTSNIRFTERENKNASSESAIMQVALGLLAITMLGIGIRPKLLLNIAIAPAAQALGMRNVDTILDTLTFWNFSDIRGMVVTLTLGILVCWGGLKSGVFHWQPPIWLTLEGLGKLAARGISVLWGVGAKLYNSMAAAIYNVIRSIEERSFSTLRRFDNLRSGTIGRVTLAGISADAALLIMTLMLLIAWYTFRRLKLFNLGLFSFLLQRTGKILK